MEIKQIYEIVNAATREAIGESVLLNEDLSNVVDVGEAILNARSMDKYTAALVDKIGKVIFVNRPYEGDVPSLYRTGFEYGAIMQKIASEMPEAVENESWELQNGASYDPNIFIRPTVEAKFFNKKTTFEIDNSIVDRQVRSAFNSAQQLDGFISMLFNDVEKSATVKLSEITMRTINNFIAETFYTMNSGGTYTGAGDTRCINLRKRYNDRFSQNISAEDALYNKDFIRYAVFEMKRIMRRMRKMSVLFNIGGKKRFTPRDLLHFVLLDDFKSAADVYLQSDTFNDEFTRLPNAETVAYWQGSGTDYGFDSITALNVKTADGHTVTPSGILGVMFDHDACGVCNPDRRTTSNWNPKAEFTNYFHKFDCQYFNDRNENFVVFYVA